MSAWYNEIDPFAAAVLRQLITGGHIAPGVVDERSIVDVRPDEIAGFTQCHFFAGFGVWSYAARRAGWPDHRPLWSMSCPCQPFSAAGAGAGFADERHLWPHACHLVAQCRPAVITGEQVASKDADPWIDLVQSDLEALGYAFGAVPFPSASIGAPHIRDRTYWMANNQSEQFSREVDIPGERSSACGEGVPFGGRRDVGRLGDDDDERLEGHRGGYQAEIGRNGEVRPVAKTGELGGLADDNSVSGGQGYEIDGRRDQRGDAEPWAGFGRRGSDCRPGPTNGFWRDPDWLFCRDGKWRPVEPGLEPLVNGAPARVGRLRGYGNAINAVQAQIFIEEMMGIFSERAAA